MPSDLTRTQIVTEVADIVGKNAAAAALSGVALSTRIGTYYVNWAQRRIARFHDFHELNTRQESATTVTSVKRYPMITGTNNLGLTRPKDITSILVVDGANSRPLIRWNTRKFTKRFPYPELYTTDRPRVYVRFGNNLDLFKVPNAAYTLHILYPQWPTPLTSDGQYSDFENKDELLVAATVMETYLALEEYKDAAVWLQKTLGLARDAMLAEGDVDWEPIADPFAGEGTLNFPSGTPWSEPGATPDDPLWGYPE